MYKRLLAKEVACLSGFFGRRRNLTCDSVIFDSYLWQDYFSLEYRIWEDRALLLRMRDEEGFFTTVPICDEETLPEAFAELEREYAAAGKKFRMRWADEDALKILQLPADRYTVTETPDLADYLYDLDLDFDVDMDGDMLIDDILMQVSDAEIFETEIGDKKARYLVKAEELPS